MYFLLKMGIFHGYVSLPEGSFRRSDHFVGKIPRCFYIHSKKSSKALRLSRGHRTPVRLMFGRMTVGWLVGWLVGLRRWINLQVKFEGILSFVVCGCFFPPPRENPGKNHFPL